jgi:xanthine dehydrogenase large subunit
MNTQTQNTPKSKLPHHLSGHAIVTGAAKFLDDEVKPANLLYAKFLPSSEAHAKILKLDISKAKAFPGVYAVLTAKDIPGENQIGHTIKDEPLLPESEVQYVGQPILLVLAENPKVAEHALKLVDIKYKKLPTILSIEDALKVNSLYVPPRKIECGDVKKGFAESDFVFEGEISTGTQEHTYLETQRCIAVPGDDHNITLYSGTQSTAEIQEIAAEVLGIRSKDVVVDVKRLGGAFGGKERTATLWACLAAFAAFTLKRPVEVKLTRMEDQAYTGKRHPFKINYKVGVTKEGKILAYDVVLHSNGGAYIDLSLPIIERGMFHADNAYYLPNARVVGKACRTNLPPNTAFRGFGAPQGIFAIECVMERIAKELNLNPIAVREINLYQENQTTHYGEVVHEACHRELFKILKEKSAYENLIRETEEFNKKNSFLKRGIGIIPVKFGISFTFTTLNQGSALIWVYTDGSISMSHGGIEMGQEINTKVAQVVAKELGVDIKRIRVESSNTQRNGNASPTAASSGADINGNAALNAAKQLKERFIPAAVNYLSEKFFCTIKAENVVFADDKIFDKNNPKCSVDFSVLTSYMYGERINLGAQGYYKTPEIFFDRDKMQGTPFYYFVYGVALQQVEVDILTGAHKLLKVYIVHDIANPLNKEIDLGQIAGAFFQGYGYATMEEMNYDESGKYLATTLSTYKVPTIRDLPEVFDIELHESPREHASVMGNKAIGEPPLIYGMGAYFAIKNALSYVDKNVELKMPATPEAIVMAVKDKSEAQK